MQRPHEVILSRTTQFRTVEAFPVWSSLRIPLQRSMSLRRICRDFKQHMLFFYFSFFVEFALFLNVPDRHRCCLHFSSPRVSVELKVVPFSFTSCTSNPESELNVVTTDCQNMKKVTKKSAQHFPCHCWWGHARAQERLLLTVILRNPKVSGQSNQEWICIASQTG